MSKVTFINLPKYDCETLRKLIGYNDPEVVLKREGIPYIIPLERDRSRRMKCVIEYDTSGCCYSNPFGNFKSLWLDMENDKLILFIYKEWDGWC